MTNQCETGEQTQGSQPVRVLMGSVLAWFEDKYPEFRQELESLTLRRGLSLTIICERGEAPIRPRKGRARIPYVDVERKQIALPETFLSYLWALSYSFLVIFDEEIHSRYAKESPGHGKSLGYFLPRAHEVLRYGLSLRDTFTPWPAGLPSPENFRPEDKLYVSHGNGIYVAAVDYVLCHEIAHFACGHVDELARCGGYLSAGDVRLLEAEADDWACERVNRGIGGQRTTETVGFGTLVGLGSLLFLGRRLTSLTHPDKDERIVTALKRLNLDNRDNLWGVAATFFVAWNEGFRVGIQLPSEAETYRDLVDWFCSALEPLKAAEGADRLGLD